VKDPYEISGQFPPGLQVVADNLDSADEKARSIVAEISDAQASWQPREGAWSISQCLDHLGRTNVAYAEALRAAICDATPAHHPLTNYRIQPGWVSGIFIRLLEPPPKGKGRAPKKIQPAANAKKDEALDCFLRSQVEVRAVLRQSLGFDLNRIRFRNPFVRSVRFTVGAGLLIVVAHDRRHLWQAEQVGRAAGFPKI
jgi:hypothetical protein